MKILFLAPGVNLSINMKGGAGTHMRASVTELRKRGHEVVVAVGGDLLSRQDNEKNRETKSNNRTIFNGIKKIIPNEIKKMIRDYRISNSNRIVFEKVNDILLNDSSFDVIYERSGYGYDVGMRLASKFDIPHCMETDVIMLDLIKKDTSVLFNKWIYRKLEKQKYQAANTITVQSDYSVELCKQYWQLTHDRVYNKDLGITPKNLQLDEGLNVNEKYDLEGKTVIGFVGYFMTYQNIPVLLKAAKYLKDLSKEVVFLLVGSGNHIDSLKKYVRTEKLTNVIFTGLVDKSVVGNYYDRIDIGVIPDCAYHMYPVKFLEYALFKLPTITPNYEPFKRFYENKSKFEAMTFNKLDSKELSERIRTSLKNLKQIKLDTEYTYNYVLNNHSWEKCGEYLEYSLNQTIDFFAKKS